MEFKGIKWAGNIYQKFETMCLEVEEVMYEDTVKYVENQVQKVGASVKKFYSEVMQDMGPPSCVDPVKVAAGDLSLNPYAHTDFNKKPKLDCQKEFKKINTKDEEISDLVVGKEVNHLSPLSSKVLVENTNSELYSVKSKKVGIQKRSIGIKRISQNNRPSKISCQTASLSGDKSIQLQKSSLDFVARHNTGEVVNENTPTIDAPVEFPASDKKSSPKPARVTEDDSESTSDKILLAEFGRRKIHNSECTPPASDKILSVESERVNNDVSKCASPVSDKILPAESARHKKDDSHSTSFSHSMPSEYIGTSVNSVSISQSGSSVKSNAREFESRGKEVATLNEGTYGSFSQSNTWDVDSAGEEYSMFYEDNFDMEVIKNEEVEQRGEIFEPVKKPTLEETCILVEGDELHSFQGIDKQKSYKKKIRNALSSKLRSKKKHNQLVSESKDLEGKNSSGSTIPTPSPSREIKVRAHESLESDWELL